MKELGLRCAGGPSPRRDHNTQKAEQVSWLAARLTLCAFPSRHRRDSGSCRFQRRSQLRGSNGFSPSSLPLPPFMDLCGDLHSFIDRDHPPFFLGRAILGQSFPPCQCIYPRAPSKSVAGLSLSEHDGVFGVPVLAKGAFLTVPAGRRGGPNFDCLRPTVPAAGRRPTVPASGRVSKFERRSHSTGQKLHAESEGVISR